MPDLSPAEHAATVGKYVLGEELRTVERMTDALDSLAALVAQAERADGDLRAAYVAVTKHLQTAEARADQLQRELTVCQAMDMTATANQWETACKTERERAERAEAALRQIAGADHWNPPSGTAQKVVLWMVQTARAALAGKTPTPDYRAALRTIQAWDCLNPPDPNLCADHPWLKQLVDAALAGETSPCGHQTDGLFRKVLVCDRPKGHPGCHSQGEAMWTPTAPGETSP